MPRGKGAELSLSVRYTALGIGRVRTKETHRVKEGEGEEERWGERGKEREKGERGK